MYKLSLWARSEGIRINDKDNIYHTPVNEKLGGTEGGTNRLNPFNFVVQGDSKRL